MSNHGSVMRQVRMFEGGFDREEKLSPLSKSNPSRVHPFNRPGRRRQMEIKEKVFPSHKGESKKSMKSQLVHHEERVEFEDRSDRNEVSSERFTPLTEDATAARLRIVTSSEREEAPATEDTTYEATTKGDHSKKSAVHAAASPNERRVHEIMASRRRRQASADKVQPMVNKDESRTERDTATVQRPKKPTISKTEKKVEVPSNGDDEKAMRTATKPATLQLSSRNLAIHRRTLDELSPKVGTHTSITNPKPSPTLTLSSRLMTRNLHLQKKNHDTNTLLKKPSPDKTKESLSSAGIETSRRESERKDKSFAMPSKFSRERGRLSPTTLTDVLRSRKQWKHGPQSQAGSSNAGSGTSSMSKSGPRNKFIQRASERITKVNSISDKGSQDNDHDQTTPSAARRNELPHSATLRTAHLQKMSARANHHFGGQNPELKRNLEAASVVMLEEKASSVSSSSSSRSSLSTEELGHIAERAIQLAKVRAETRTSRLENSPLHQILKEKRDRKMTIQSSKTPTTPQTLHAKPGFQPRDYTNVHSSRTAPPVLLESQTRLGANQTARVDTRISNCINRAEKFASLHRNALQPVVERKATGEGAFHPIFRYAVSAKPAVKVEPKREEEDDASTVVSDSPSIKRQVRPALVSAVHKARTTRTQSNAGSRTKEPPEEVYKQPSKPERLDTKPVSPTNSVSTQSTMSLAQRSHEVKDTVKRARQARIERESSRRKDTAVPTVDVDDSPNSAGHFSDGAFDFFAQSGRILDNFAANNGESEINISEAKLPTGACEQFDFKTVDEKNYSHKPDQGEGQSDDMEKSDSSDDSSEGSEFVEQLAGSESLQSDAESPFREAPKNEAISFSPTVSKSGSKSSLSSKESDRQSTLASSLKEGSSGLTFAETSSALEKHDSNQIVAMQDNNSSSESSSSRPEALRWWQKNYGKKVTGATNNAVRNALSKISPSSKRKAENCQKRIEADEDDIFDGLEEDTAPKEARIEYDFEECDASSSDPDEIGIPAPFGSHYLEKGKDSRSPTRMRSLPPPPPPPVSAHLRPRDTNASTVIAETELFSEDSSKSVTSDVTMSQLTGKSRSSRFRSNVVETIMEGSHEDERIALDPSAATDENKLSQYSLDVDEDDDTVDRINVEESAPSKEESARGAKSPNSSVFLHLGCAFVDSISNVCVPPGPVPVNGECVAKTKRDCEEKARALFHNRAGTVDEYSTTFMDDGTKTSFGRSYDASTFFTHRGEMTTATNSYTQLNDEERQIWHEWDNRDETSLEKILADKRTQPSDSSGSGGEQQKKLQHHEAARTEAQRKLIEHADTAMAQQGIRKGNSAEARPVPAPIEVNERHLGDVILRSPNGVDVALNFNQLSLLEKFSLSLKNGDVEVLKLGRRNRWQPRYLSVSEDVTWLRRDDSEGAVGQCPKALLWQKQPGSKHQATSIRAEGRGGFDFCNLKSVRLEDSCPQYDRIPRRLKSKFPEFAGVTVEYEFEGGERQLILCFKGKGEASAFNTAIGIIKLVVDREKEYLKQQTEAARRGVV